MTRPASAGTDSDTEFAATARHLASRLTSLAVFDARGRPTWTGDEVDPTQPPETDPPRLVHGPLDDGLLTGRTGIAVALAGCSTLPGASSGWSMLARRTLEAALAHRPTPAYGTLGWQSGDLGVARGAGLVGRLLGDESLVHAGRDLAGRAVEALYADPTLCPAYPDLLDGEAGHLAAVLAADLPGSAEDARRAVAADLIARLTAGAESGARGASWSMAGFAPSVVGLAHGGSGIALALTAAQAAGLRVDEGLVAAALRWEDGHYAADRGGWPDLRVDPPVPALAWCHGAPGVGIVAAARAMLVDDAATVITFTRATRAAAAHLPARTSFDGTQCHGLAGVVELHLAGAAAWPRAAGDHLRAARMVARHLTRAGQEQHPPWVCGVRGGRTPNVLTGVAGVALTVLRCHDPAIVPALTHPGPPARPASNRAGLRQ